MATIRYRWGMRGYVAIGVVTVAVAAAIGYRGESFDAVVVRVVDGDTLAVQGSSGELVIRLWGIDAPEMDQVWGMESKVALGRLCIAESVHVDVVAVDQYKRRVCKVKMADGRDLADEMVRAGAAWWASQYAPRDVVKKGLMLEAQAGKIGLWSYPTRVPPWIHRHGRRRVSERTALDLQSSAVLPAYLMGFMRSTWAA